MAASVNDEMRVTTAFPMLLLLADSAAYEIRHVEKMWIKQRSPKLF